LGVRISFQHAMKSWLLSAVAVTFVIGVLVHVA